MKSENASDLKLFNEKAAFLLNSNFANAMLKNQSGVMFSWEIGKSYEVILLGAEGKSVDAAFLTIRMFLQNNDRISIANIAKIYLCEQELQPYQADFNKIRDQVNIFLESSNEVVFFGKNYSNREAIELLLYGSKGHTNREKEADLKALSDCDLIWKIYLQQVNSAATQLILGIELLAKINKRALSDLKLAN